MNVNGIIFDTPCIEPVADDVWRIKYDWTIVFRGDYYTVPAGFETDGASIPRFLWRICGHPLTVPRLYAAFVHDWLYSGGDPDATKKDADDLYRDLQISLGVSRAKAYIEWSALRIFGGPHWHEFTKTPFLKTRRNKL